jgi:hypothetical protein
MPLGAEPVLLDLPFRGRWLARHSPARRVPSHGSHAFGTTYAIDFVPVDARGRSAPLSWRTLVGVEPPDAFVGFGRPVLAPAAGTLVLVHDGEPDHGARRSLVVGLPYALGQAGRVRQGAAAIAGNHVVIALGPAGPFVLLAHLRAGTVRVAPGQPVATGTEVGRCGNSGNSTEPHVHLQVTDSTSWPSARGLPIAFRRPGGPDPGGSEEGWLPAESEIVDTGPS